MTIEFTTGHTLIVACMTLFLGKLLNNKIQFFKEYNIPEPVTGGVIVSLLFGLAYLFGITVSFDLEQRDALLVVFFTTIGLSAKFDTLKKGGKSLAILTGLAVAYLFIQNIVGISVMTLFGFPPVQGLLGGSVSLSGGHGTTIAWTPVFISEYAIYDAMELGIASATFGLVAGGLIGGPLAKYLISRHDLKPTDQYQATVGRSKEDGMKTKISYDNMLLTIFTLSLAVSMGIGLNELLIFVFNFKLPGFVTALFSGIIITNLIPILFPKSKWTPTRSSSVALWSDLSLGLFLAMSLMSLQLWTLIDLAGPLIVILILQILVVTGFAILVIFRMMGKTYDAAIISAGYVGLAMGATPTAIANMTAVTQKFGGSPKAFIIVPLVGALFIDISNALIIKFFLTWLG